MPKQNVSAGEVAEWFTDRFGKVAEVQLASDDQKLFDRVRTSRLLFDFMTRETRNAVLPPALGCKRSVALAGATLAGPRPFVQAAVVSPEPCPLPAAVQAVRADDGAEARPRARQDQHGHPQDGARHQGQGGEARREAAAAAEARALLHRRRLRHVQRRGVQEQVPGAPVARLVEHDVAAPQVPLQRRTRLRQPGRAPNQHQLPQPAGEQRRASLQQGRRLPPERAVRRTLQRAARVSRPPRERPRSPGLPRSSARCASSSAAPSRSRCR